MAPEVVREHYSHPADVWSAGIVAYLLLTGRLPYPFWEKLYVTKEVGGCGRSSSTSGRALAGGRLQGWLRSRYQHRLPSAEVLPWDLLARATATTIGTSKLGACVLVCVSCFACVCRM